MFVGDNLFDELTRHVLNLAGTGILAIIAVLLRRLWKAVSAVPARLDHLDKCLDDLRQAVNSDRAETVKYRQNERELMRQAHEEVAELKRDYAGLEGYMKGINGVSIDTPITDIRPKESGTV